MRVKIKIGILKEVKIGVTFVERNEQLGNVFITFHYRLQLSWLIGSLFKVVLNK